MQGPVSVPIIYTNAANVELSLYDFKIILGVGNPEGLTPAAQVHMSPQHFKVLVKIMAENLRNYEELFGTINLEPNEDKVEELKRKGIVMVNKNDK